MLATWALGTSQWSLSPEGCLTCAEACRPPPITVPFPVKEALVPRAGSSQAARPPLGPVDGSRLCTQAFKAPRFV